MLQVEARPGVNAMRNGHECQGRMHRQLRGSCISAPKTRPVRRPFEQPCPVSVSGSADEAGTFPACDSSCERLQKNAERLPG